MIHIGDTATGERVELPVHHTGVFGASGVGKTRLLKYMMNQAVGEGYRVLVFDSKVTGPEFEGIGKKVPFYLEQSTDPDVFRSLIESVRTRGKGNMERYRPAFIQLCRDTEDFAGVVKRLKSKLADKHINGYTRTMYEEIDYDFGVLRKLLGLDDEGRFVLKSKFTFADGVEVDESVCVMPVNELPNLALMGLVVRSTVEYLMKHDPGKLIILTDEAPNFVNQKVYNPAKPALQMLDAQGRSKRIFGWYSGQTLTGFAKENMKNLYYWVMGREMERNEAKAVHDTMTEKVLTVDKIKMLKTRQFLVSTPDWTKQVLVPEVSDPLLKVPPEAVPWHKGGGYLPPDNVAPGFGSASHLQAEGVDPDIAKSLDDLKAGRFKASHNTEELFADLDSKEDKGQGLMVTGFSLGGEKEEEPDEGPRPPDAVTSETKPIGSFTLEVTRLKTDSLEAKVVYILHTLKKAAYPKEVITEALEYGWVINGKNFGRDIAPTVVDGLVLKMENGMYRLPEKITVVEVANA